MEKPLWFKNAVFYQINVKCFRDSNGDGIGDFKGLTEKLDHIQNLGCNAIWLQPFYPSPLKDDGYDIADYTAIHPDYGTMDDFKEFLKEAKKRGLKVVTELVLNHTSDQHNWFKRARSSPKGSKWRDFYIWSETPDKYMDCRIIFKDFETANWAFDVIADSYFFHRFYSHQPDLNYDNPEVHDEIFKIVDLWLGMGVDGLRLDAVPYLYKREGTDCENLPETHIFLQKLRKYIDTKYEDRMLLAEANQWPEEACLYFGTGNECHMAFHFPVMPRLFMAIQKEDRFPIVDILEQTPKPPKECQWAMFLRNHDELTLEMVTDEERDFMWHAYAKDPRARINLGIRRRLAPLMDDDRQKIELMFTLLFSLPGSPVIYYGDEIGMGDNYYLGDRNGVRTPMQWNIDRNAGFSEADPQKLYLPLIIDPKYHHTHINVENQEQSPSSLLSWMKSIISVREQHTAFGSGAFRYIPVKNSKILAFVRETENDAILVIVNLSQHSQYAEIDLKEWMGFTPIDLFSHNHFAKIGDSHYGIILGRYGSYWLSLKQTALQVPMRKYVLKTSWNELFQGENRALLQKETLPAFLANQRWFRSKDKPIKKVIIRDEVDLEDSKFLNINVIYIDDSQEGYQLPVTVARESENPNSVIAEINIGGKEGVLVDAVHTNSFRKTLYEALVNKSHFGPLSFNLDSSPGHDMKSSLMTEEQTNTSINYGDSVLLKLYRRLEEGSNPDFELIKHLSLKSKYHHIPEYLGGIEWQSQGAKSQIGLAERFVAKGESAWNYTQRMLKGEVAVADYLKFVGLLGKRTAELHLALSEIASEPFSMLYQKSLYQAMRTQIKTTFQLLREQKGPLVDEALAQEKTILDMIKLLEKRRFVGHKIRIHGDLHLGQVLLTGDDLVFIDFEGEPSLPIAERRLKRPVIQDVASMLRSFDYAATYFGVESKESVNQEFLDKYLQEIKKAKIALIPDNEEDFNILKNAYLLNKAVYEIGYDLKNRPSWVQIPLKGLLNLLKGFHAHR